MTRKPISIQQTTVPIIAEHKFLGIILDQELRWNAHINYALTKGIKWITQYRRLTKPMKGAPVKHMRRFYIMIAIPQKLYAADLFLTPQYGPAHGSKSHIKSLGRVQHQAALITTGALRTTPTDSLDAHTDLLPFRQLVEKLLHQAATRIATLPATHLLAAHARKAEKKYVKSHRSPLHQLQHAHKIIPSEFE